MSNLSVDELQAAAGMADSTYRRAKAMLLAKGEATGQRWAAAAE